MQFNNLWSGVILAAQAGSLRETGRRERAAVRSGDGKTAVLLYKSQKDIRKAISQAAKKADESRRTAYVDRSAELNAKHAAVSVDTFPCPEYRR